MVWGAQGLCLVENLREPRAFIHAVAVAIARPEARARSAALTECIACTLSHLYCVVRRFLQKALCACAGVRQGGQGVEVSWAHAVLTREVRSTRGILWRCCKERVRRCKRWGAYLVLLHVLAVRLPGNVT